MEDKVEEYLKILYPNRDTLDKKEKCDFERKKIFIIENIEEVDKRYKKEINEENDVREDIEEIEEDEKEENIEKDIEDKIENNEQEEQNENEEKSEEQISEQKDNTSEEEIVEQDEKLDQSEETNKEVLNKIIKEIKIDNYFSLLHPDYEELAEEDKYFVYDDKILIRDAIDAIDAYYYDCKAPGSGAEEMEWTDQMIIEAALRLFNRQEKIFTPDDIEQFSSSVKYEEFNKAITTIKEIATDEQEDVTTDKQEE